MSIRGKGTEHREGRNEWAVDGGEELVERVARWRAADGLQLAAEPARFVAERFDHPARDGTEPVDHCVVLGGACADGDAGLRQPAEQALDRDGPRRGGSPCETRAEADTSAEEQHDERGHDSLPASAVLVARAVNHPGGCLQAMRYSSHPQTAKIPPTTH